MNMNDLDNLANSPAPAFTLGAALLGKGLTTTKVPESLKEGTLGGSFRFGRSLATSRPTKVSCYLFGAAHLLGGYMNIDGDPLNAAGFTFAWSTLYLIVNGGAGIKSLWKARVAPFGLTVLALGNAGIYGRKFFWNKG